LLYHRLVNRDDATGESPVAGVAKPGLDQEPAKCVRFGKTGDGVGKITISALLLAQHAADDGKQSVKIEPIRPAQQRMRGLGELEDGEHAAWTEDPAKLAQAGAQVLEVPHAEADGDRVERAGREGQAQGVRRGKTNRGFGPRGLVLGSSEHLPSEVARRAASVGCHLEREVARPTADIENAVAGFEAQTGHDVAPPAVDGFTPSAMLPAPLPLPPDPGA